MRKRVLVEVLSGNKKLRDMYRDANLSDKEILENEKRLCKKCGVTLPKNARIVRVPGSEYEEED